MDTIAPDPRRWWALALLCGAFFMVILDAAIVTVALPSIQEDLGFSTQGLQWVVSAYALTFAGLLMLGGRAADLLGRRRVFMVGLLFFTLAIWGMNGAFGATAGYLIGGPLVDGPGWEWIFFINIPVGLIALALSPVLLRESRATTARRSYDPAGALTITGALVVLVYGLVEAPDAGWGSPQTILLLAGAAALLAIFALIESRHPAPLVPLRMLRSRTL